nr:MAG TPA: hypothetical protein [Bacteriophage sp.]
MSYFPQGNILKFCIYLSNVCINLFFIVIRFNDGFVCRG